MPYSDTFKRGFSKDFTPYVSNTTFQQKAVWPQIKSL